MPVLSPGQRKKWVKEHMREVRMMCSLIAGGRASSVSHLSAQVMIRSIMYESRDTVSRIKVARRLSAASRGSLLNHKAMRKMRRRRSYEQPYLRKSEYRLFEQLFEFSGSFSDFDLKRSERATNIPVI